MKFKDFLKEWSHTPISIKPYMEKKGYKFLGKGVDQSAYLEPKTGKILKIFGTQSYSNNNKNGYTADHLMFKAFANYCEKNKDNEFLPKFDGWEGFEYGGKKFLQIRMEKLQKLPTQLGDALENLANDIDAAHDKSDFVDDIVAHVHELDDEDESPIHLMKSQALEVEKLMVLLGESQFKLFLNTIGNLSKLAYEKGYTTDLHGGNFMHRNDGIPVIVDPWVV
jgi:hypothetical protein